MAITSGPAALEDNSRLHRPEPFQLGIWILLAVVTMLFAAFTSAYLVRAAGTDWDKIPIPSLVWLNTAVLIASSLALERSRFLGKRAGKRDPAKLWLAVSLVLGIGFLIGQWVVWSQLRALGVFIATSPYSSFFYLLTSTHALHLVTGLTCLAVAMVRMVGGSGSRISLGVATYWHFLALLWVYVLVVLEFF